MIPHGQGNPVSGLAATTSSGLIGRAAGLVRRFQETAGAIDRPDGFPAAELAELHRAGLLVAPLAEALGGGSLGLDRARSARAGATHALLRVLEEVGRGNLALGRIYEGHVNALLLLQRWGRADQVEEWSALARAGRVFGVWNSQAGDGVSIGAEDDQGRVEVRGAKTFASGAGWIARPIITGALVDGRSQMAVVPVDEVDARVDRSGWQPLGMRASASHRVEFPGVRVSARRCLLGPPGAYLQEPWFSSGAIRFAAVQLGGAAALLDATVASLRAWGRADDPYQRARVGTMAIAVESGRQWLRAAAEVADQRVDAGNRPVIGAIMAHAQMTRTALETICQDVIRLAEQSVGVRGLIATHPIERIGRDLTTYLRQPAPDLALAEVGRTWLDPDGFRPDRGLTDRGALDGRPDA